MNRHDTARSRDEIESLLERALHDRFDAQPVEVGRLLVASRQRARQVRSRRRATFTACAASLSVAAVTVAVGASRPQSDRDTVATAAVAARPTTSPAAAANTPSPSASPGWSDPAKTAYDIPDSVNLRAADFPRRMSLLPGLGRYSLIAPIDGLYCNDPSATGPTPVAGRSWTWVEEASNRAQLSATLVVTGWAPGTGAKRFAEVVNGTGLCRWLKPQHRAGTAGLSGDDVWAGSETVRGYAVFREGRAAVRLGDVIVAVSVSDDRGTEQTSVALAKRLVSRAVERLQAAGLPATRAAR